MCAAGTAMTKHFEGCPKDAQGEVIEYSDGIEGAIGYGHDDPALKPGDTETQEQADANLAADQAKAGARLVHALGQDVCDALTDGQWAALVDFSYNAGVEIELPIWQHVKGGQASLVPEDLGERVFNRAGVALAGLILRREAEAALWNGAETFTPPTSADIAAARAKAAALNA